MMEEKRRIWANKKILAIIIIFIVVIIIILPIIFIPVLMTNIKIAIYGEDYLLITYSFVITPVNIEDDYIIELPIPRLSYLPVWDIIDDLERLDGNISMSLIVETRTVLESNGPEEKQLDYLKITGCGSARAVFQTINKNVGYFVEGVNVNGTIETYFETSGNDVYVDYNMNLKKEMISPSGTSDFYEYPHMGLPNKIEGCQGRFEQNGWHEVELNRVWY